MISTNAVIHPNAKIGKNVTISHFAVIEDDVIIGDDCHIHPHAIIMSGTRLGKGCIVYPNAVLGADPQDLKYKGEYTTLEVGDYVTFREGCSINRGTAAYGKTVIGSHSLILCQAHIAHDCILGEHCILSGYAGLAGHVELGNHVILGGYTAIHQFVKVGDHVMIRGGSLVGKDVPPYVRAAKDPTYYSGVNTIGLRRRGFTKQDVHHIQDIYRSLFNKGMNVSQALDFIDVHIEDSKYKKNILDFIRSSTRGIIKGSKSLNGHTVEWH